MMKKIYNKPTLSIVLLKSDIHLLVDSYQVSNYKEGGTTTVGDDDEE